MKNTRVSAGRCTRAELARYFTITAKSIKANRNSAAQRSSIARTCGCADILDATRSSCEVIRAPLRPRSTLSPASGNTPRVTRALFIYLFRAATDASVNPILRFTAALRVNLHWPRTFCSNCPLRVTSFCLCPHRMGLRSDLRLR